MRVLAGLVRLGIALCVLGAAALSVAALTGFSVSRFDLLNHFQVIIFAGTLAGLLAVVLFFRGSLWLGPVVAIALVGFVSSAVTFGPELVSGLVPRAPLPADGRSVYRLMSNNLFAKNADIDLAADEVLRQDPDIIAFQEYFRAPGERLLERLGQRYPYVVSCFGVRRGFLAIYAKLPFDAATEGPCNGDGSPGQRTVRLIAHFLPPGGAPFTVMTTHLDWPAPITRQDNQFAVLAESVSRIAGPLLLAGDFNSTPWSYALRNFEAHSGLHRETRNLATFPAIYWIRGALRRTPQLLPIDHVFTRGLDVHVVEKGDFTGSDHLPVVVQFSVPPS